MTHSCYKTHLLVFKERIASSIDHYLLNQLKNQRNLGLQISQNLLWIKTAYTGDEQDYVHFSQ